MNTEKVRRIKLTREKFAIIDDADYPLVRGYKWHALPSREDFYASTTITTGVGKRKSIKMHQLIFGKNSDHKNGNTLDNRRSNLRKATPSQNGANSKKQKNTSSIYKGVSLRKISGNWGASIQKDGKQYHIGTFKTEIEAAKAYDKKAVEFFGEYARLNF